MNKYIYYILFLLLSYSKHGFNQNLVPNPSFEYYTNCPVPPYGGIYLAAPWTATFNSPNEGNSEYYNSCDSIIKRTGVPSNLFGYQYARTGNGYAGTAFYELGKVYRENLQVKLFNKLRFLRKYNVKFYVSLAEKAYTGVGIDAIQAYFSPTRVISLPSTVYNCNPQISNLVNNIITDTAGWQKIEGEFTAQGVEQYMVIGNFKPDSLVHFQQVIPSSYGAYYYIDDVSVEEVPYCAEAGRDTSICKGDGISLGNYNFFDYEYEWFPKKWLSDTASGTPIATPDSSITYYLHQKDFKDTLTIDSVTIIVYNCKINAGTDTSICAGDSIQLGMPSIPIATYSWQPATDISNPNVSNPKAAPQNTTNYILTVNTLNHPTKQDTVKINVYNCNLINAGIDTSICVGDSIQLGMPSIPIATYTWQPATDISNPNISNPKVAPQSTTNYILTVNTLNHPTKQDSIKINVYNCDTIKAFAGKDTSICLGDTVFLGKSSVPVCSYNWQPTTYLNNSNISNPYTLPNNTITYYLYLNIPNHQTKKDSIKINVYNCDTVKAKAINDTSLCIGDSVKIGGSSNPLYQYTWQPPFYLNNSTISNPVSKPQNSTNYVLSVKFLRVTVKDTVKLTVYNCDSVLAEAGKDTSICPNSSVQLGTKGNPLFKYSWQPAEYLSNANIANPLAVPLNTTMYYVTVKILSRTAKDSVKITIRNCDTTEIEINIPNVITPNNDGRNDEFIITGLPEYSNLKIFNRWGKTIYESNNYQNNYNFLEVSDGTYYFILTTPKNKIYKGIITIVR